MRTARLTVTLDDGYGMPMSIAIDIDDVVRIAPRAVAEMKAGVSNFDGTTTMMQRREFRKKLFIQETTRLGALSNRRVSNLAGTGHDDDCTFPA